MNLKKASSFFVLLYLVIFTNSISVNARKKEIVCDFNYCSNISIDDVRRSKKKTTVSITVNSKNGSSFYLIPNFRIVNERGDVYPAHTLKDASWGRNVIKKGNRHRFKISFPPLAKQDSIYDILSGYTDNDFFKFYSVHASDVKVEYPNLDIEHYQPVNTFSLSKSKTCILGHVDLSRDQNESLSIAHLDMQDEGYLKIDNVQVDSAGYFKLSVDIHGPEYAYLRFTGSWVPIFLNPDDTILCNISNLREPKQVIEYHSLKGYDLHLPLVKANLTGPWCDEIRKTLTDVNEYPSLCNKIDSIKENVYNFFCYITWKYKLTPSLVSR